MTIHRSQHSTDGETRNLRDHVTIPAGLRHHGLNRVRAELAVRATAEPPTYREVAAEIGWPAAADRVNAWAAAGYQGDWWEGRYGRPAPQNRRAS
ncbi:hypothetical protein [Krasilnikovia sp. MM14-A1259]|uniref:hypothetical protein n=1 Tax=Krasilnikovia sp. MM14-A1259 TaxID=3373539 RepID=UPI003819478C